MSRELDNSIRAHIDELSRLADKYVDERRSVSVAGYLPGAEKRALLQQIAWEATLQVQEELVKSDETASRATYRLNAFRVFTALIRAELPILLDMDEMFLDDLIEEVRKSNQEPKQGLEDLKRDVAFGLR